VLRVSESQDSVWVLVVRTLQPAALIALLVLALAAWMAGRVSRQIVAPINALDPAAPGDGPVYDELTPLLARIQNQNRQIRAQMEELRRRQEEFAAVTENMGEGLVILDAEERVLFRNAAAERLLCAAPPSGELCALDLSRESAFRRAAAEAVAGRRCEEMLEREGRASQIVATPVTREGQPSGAVLVILDVTEKEQREAPAAGVHRQRLPRAQNPARPPSPAPRRSWPRAWCGRRTSPASPKISSAAPGGC
jgi:two-component system phosphate regulon sensor histidine kinase PhoR